MFVNIQNEASPTVCTCLTPASSLPLPLVLCIVPALPFLFELPSHLAGSSTKTRAPPQPQRLDSLSGYGRPERCSTTTDQQSNKNRTWQAHVSSSTVPPLRPGSGQDTLRIRIQRLARYPPASRPPSLPRQSRLTPLSSFSSFSASCHLPSPSSFLPSSSSFSLPLSLSLSLSPRDRHPPTCDLNLTYCPSWLPIPVCLVS